ncbi:MAG: LysR family transcriptional regulator [Gammaproteobacteria bacterium]
MLISHIKKSWQRCGHGYRVSPDLRRVNFVSAADDLHITQAAVRQRIKAAEDCFGCKLFVRPPFLLRTSLGL